MAEAKVITAIKALVEMLKSSAHVSAVEGWSVCSDYRDLRLPGVDVAPGALMRVGQEVEATIVFTIAAPVRGNVATAVNQIYQIDGGLFNAIFHQLTGDARKLFGNRLAYGGIVTPPGMVERTEERPEPILVARAEATFRYLEPMASA